MLGSCLVSFYFLWAILCPQAVRTYHIFQVAKLFSYTWTFGMAACKLLYYVQTVTVVCSVLNLTALSIER